MRVQQPQQLNLRGGVKTKKYKLENNTYIKLSLQRVLVQFWWAFLVPVAIVAMGFVFPKALGWLVGIALTLTVLYVLFWLIQFVGVTQLPQNKPMFERMSYEFDARLFLMRVNQKQAMQLTWDQIKSARKTKDAFLLIISRAQFIHLPFTIFNSENDRRLTEAILRRKSLLPAAPPEKSGSTTTERKPDPAPAERKPGAAPLRTGDKNRPAPRA